MSDNGSQFDIEALAEMASRRIDYADNIRNPGLVLDLRLAAQACEKFSSLQFDAAEIAERALREDGGGIHRDLKDALAKAQGGV